MTRCVKNVLAVATVVSIGLISTGASSATPVLGANTAALNLSQFTVKTALIDSPLFAINRTVTDGVSVRLYQRAIDKVLADLPTVIGPVLSQYGLSHVFQSGSDSYWGCRFGYELGVRNGNF